MVPPVALDRAMLIPDLSRLAKALAESVLIGVGVIAYHVGLAPMIINRGRGRVRVLMYHACEEHETDFLRGLSINTRPGAWRHSSTSSAITTGSSRSRRWSRGRSPNARSSSRSTTDSGRSTRTRCPCWPPGTSPRPATSSPIGSTMARRSGSTSSTHSFAAIGPRRRPSSCAGCSSTVDARCPSSSGLSWPVTTPPSSPTC